MAVRNLQPVDGGGARRGRKPTLAGDSEHVDVDCHVKISMLHAGERRDDPELPIGFENIDGRLPIRDLHRNARLEEPTMQMLRPCDHREGLIPHPDSWIAYSHRNSLRTSTDRVPVGGVMILQRCISMASDNSSKAKDPSCRRP